MELPPLCRTPAPRDAPRYLPHIPRASVTQATLRRDTAENRALLPWLAKPGVRGPGVIHPSAPGVARLPRKRAASHDPAGDPTCLNPPNFKPHGVSGQAFCLRDSRSCPLYVWSIPEGVLFQAGRTTPWQRSAQKYHGAPLPFLTTRPRLHPQ